MSILSGAKAFAVNTALAAAKPLIEKAVGRYMVIHGISKDEGKFVLSGAILGGGDVTITLGDLEIPEDGTSMVVGSASSSLEGITNLLNDFVVGRKMPVPEKLQAAAKKVRLIL